MVVLRGVILGPMTTSTIEDSSERGPFKVSLTKTNLVEGSTIHNLEGLLVGMKTVDNSMIPYSTIRAHLQHLYSSTLTVTLPSFDLKWSPCSREMIETYTGSSSLNGIRVRDVGSRSILPDLRGGDLITHITYSGLGGFLDRYGDVVVCRIPEESPHSNTRAVLEAKPNELDVYISSHKRTLSEIIDSIPVGSNITLQICRDRSWYRLHSQNLPRGGSFSTLPHYIQVDYELFCGMCIMERSGQLIITHIFPTSAISQLIIDNRPTVLTEVDSVNVNTLEDLRDSIRACSDNPRISINGEFIFSRYTMGLDDTFISKNYSIDNSHTSLINSMSPSS